MKQKINGFIQACCLVLVTSSCSSVSAQDVVSVEMSEMTVKNERLVLILDSLIDREIRCGHFDGSLNWIIGIKKKDDAYLIEVTLASVIPSSYVYFYLDSFPFFVHGDSIESIFVIQDNMQKFSYKKKKGTPYIEDHSSWIYQYLEGEISLVKDFPLKC